MAWVMRHAGTVLVAYLLGLVIVLLLPSPTLGVHAVLWASRGFADSGVASSATLRPIVEFAENVVIFVPVTVLGSLVLPRLAWWRLTLGVCLGSVLVESLQGIFLSERSASVSDVVANTLGALIGTVVATSRQRN